MSRNECVTNENTNQQGKAAFTKRIFRHNLAAPAEHPVDTGREHRGGDIVISLKIFCVIEYSTCNFDKDLFDMPLITNLKEFRYFYFEDHNLFNYHHLYKITLIASFVLL
jgi:hypothetical protein